MSTIHAGVLIIGAGAAGTGAAGELLTLGYEGRVTVVNAEAGSPYNRTAVNKGLLDGRATLASVTLPLPEDEATTFWPGRRVTGLDTEARTALLDNGERLGYDAVIVATGADPRRLGVTHSAAAAERIRVLRTAKDASAFRAAMDLAAGRRQGQPVRVGVVGAGLLGAETADSLAAEGAAVTLIDPAPAPLDRLLGGTVGAWVRDQQRRRMTLALGTTVIAVHMIGDAVVMLLSDGVSAVVDVVLVATGVTPATAFLSSCLPSSREGVLTDTRLRVLDAGRVYAAGDVARLRRGESLLRGEHWGYALAQGRHAARVLLHDLGVGADPGPFEAPEAFATRLHGKTVTVLGRPEAGSHEVVFAGRVEDDAVTVGFVDRAERLVGAVALGKPRTVNSLRPMVAARATLDEARALVDDRAPAIR